MKDRPGWDDIMVKKGVGGSEVGYPAGGGGARSRQSSVSSRLPAAHVPPQPSSLAASPVSFIYLYILLLQKVTTLNDSVIR